MISDDYKIKPLFCLLRDKETVNFHVRKNDYFGTLATIIKLVNQDNILEDKVELKKILKKLEKDLIYLQKNFIIKKSLLNKEGNRITKN